MKDVRECKCVNVMGAKCKVRLISSVTSLFVCTLHLVASDCVDDILNISE